MTRFKEVEEGETGYPMAREDRETPLSREGGRWGPGELGRLWGCLGDHVCTGLRGASWGKGGKGSSGPLGEGHGPGGPREHPPEKEGGGGRLRSAEEGGGARA